MRSVRVWNHKPIVMERNNDMGKVSPSCDAMRCDAMQTTKKASINRHHNHHSRDKGCATLSNKPPY